MFLNGANKRNASYVYANRPGISGQAGPLLEQNYLELAPASLSAPRTQTSSVLNAPLYSTPNRDRVLSDETLRIAMALTRGGTLMICCCYVCYIFY
jgi:hypothetical protein